MFEKDHPLEKIILTDETGKKWHQCFYDQEVEKGFGAYWKCFEWDDGTLTLEVCRQDPIKVDFCPFCGFKSERPIYEKQSIIYE